MYVYIHKYARLGGPGGHAPPDPPSLNEGGYERLIREGERSGTSKNVSTYIQC